MRNPKGQMIVENDNGAVTSTKQFVWCGLEPCEERDASDTVTKRFFAEGEQINGVNYYFTRDHLGSVREMTDSSETIRARYDYDPYGRRTKVSGDMDADFGFTGDYYHAPSELCLTLFRAYDPDAGRWLSRDPIGEAGGINLYGYVANNPVNYVDPLGLWWWDGGYVQWGVGGLLGFHGGDVASGAWSGFGEGWSKGGQGVVNDFTGGLFNSQNGLFYNSIDQLDKSAFGSGIKCDSAFEFGSNAGRVAEAALLAAGALQATGLGDTPLWGSEPVQMSEGGVTITVPGNIGTDLGFDVNVAFPNAGENWSLTWTETGGGGYPPLGPGTTITGSGIY